MPQRETGLSAFVGAFGNAFAATHNRRIQHQMAQRHSLDQGIIEVANKALIDNPELAQDADFMKMYAAKAGKDTAKMMAEIVGQYAQSPMGILKKAVGEDVITAPVSMGADGPGTGPSMSFADLPMLERSDIARERLAELSPVEVGLGFKPSLGALQAETQKTADGNMTEYQRRSLELREQEASSRQTARQQAQTNADRTFEANEAQRVQQQKNADRNYYLALQKQKTAEEGEQRRTRVERTQRALGKEVQRQLESPTGDIIPYMARQVVNDDGSVTETPISWKLDKPAEGALQNISKLNTGIRAAGELKDLFMGSPEKISRVLTPFIGDTIDNVLAKGGQLTPEQRRFVLLVKELRAMRSFAEGGKNLTLNELQIFDSILPTLNESAETLPIVIDHALESLTNMGVDNENAHSHVGIRVPPTLVNKHNRDLVKHRRRQRPTLPKATTYEAPPAAPAAGGGQDDGSAALDAMFLQ